MAAMSVIGTPSARRRIIRARLSSPIRMVVDRCHARSVRRSAGVRVMVREVLRPRAIQRPCLIQVKPGTPWGSRYSLGIMCRKEDRDAIALHRLPACDGRRCLAHAGVVKIVLPVITILFGSTHVHQRSTDLSVRRGLDWVLASALDGVPGQVTDDVQKFYLTVNRCSPMSIVYPPAIPFCNFRLCLKVRLGYLLRRLDDGLSAFRSVKTRVAPGARACVSTASRMHSYQRSPQSQLYVSKERL
jgi:hypothetical protein